MMPTASDLTFEFGFILLQIESSDSLIKTISSNIKKTKST